MSLGIKFLILFLLVESSTAEFSRDMLFKKRRISRDLFVNEKQINPHELEMNYFEILRGMIRGWLREAEEKYPLRMSTNYMDRSFFLQEKARAYVQLWGRWKNHRGYPYGDLRNKLQGDLWGMQYDYCRQSEGANLLTYLIHGLSAETDMV